MLKVKMTVYDGCNWNHSNITKYFKNEDDLNDFIKCCEDWMDQVFIDSKEEVNENENNL